VLVLRTADASPGIAITLRGARFASYQVVVANGLTIQTLQLGFDGFAITDVGSGKTAQSWP
jgi:hypothetical protein